MSIYQNIDYGKYDNKLPWSDHNLTIADNKLMKAKHNEESRQLEQLFFRDLCEQIGMSWDTPRADLLYSHAYGKGHAGGFHDIAGHFFDLSDFIDKWEDWG
jgi:hypothetical protein